MLKEGRPSEKIIGLKHDAADVFPLSGPVELFVSEDDAIPTKGLRDVDQSPTGDIPSELTESPQWHVLTLEIRQNRILWIYRRDIAGQSVTAEGRP
jgi:hypothetical protein